MMFDSAFIINHSYLNRFDYAMAITYFAKGSKSSVEMDDIKNIIKKLNITALCDYKAFEKYIACVNHSTTTNNEISDSKEFFDLYDNVIESCDLVDSFIHNFNPFKVEDSFVKLAYFIDLKLGKSPEYETSIKYIFRNNKDFSFCENYRKLENAFKLIHSHYYDIAIEKAIHDEVLLDLFGLLGIDTIGSLVRCDYDVVYMLLCREFERYTDLFHMMSEINNNLENVIFY